jgi:hypothetical protein
MTDNEPADCSMPVTAPSRLVEPVRVARATSPILNGP